METKETTMVLKRLKRKLIKNFRSDTDKLLDQLNQSQENTQSVQFEVEKHAKLHDKRDQAQPKSSSKDDIWENF